jgi:hypothetical protein
LSEKRQVGWSQSNGKYVFFVDDDITLSPHCISNLAKVLDNFPYVGIVAPVVDDGVHCWGMTKRSLLFGFVRSYSVGNDVSICDTDECDNAFMVRREVLQALGGFDCQHFPIDLDEADLCLRARRLGWEVVYVGAARVKHASAFSRFPKFRRKKNAYYMGRNRILFHRKHLGFMYLFYLLLGLPAFVLIYLVSLVMVGQTRFVPVFLHGVFDGLRNRLDGGKGY